MASSARFDIQKLNGSNYAVWKCKVENLLVRDKVWCAIRDDPPAEESPAEAKREWLEKDDQARSAIFLLVEDNQLIHIMGSTTAKQAWDKLKGHYERTTYSNKIFLLRDIFLTKLQEDGNMEDHITEMLKQVNRLSAMGKNLEDDMVAALLLANLPDSYSTLIMSLESRDEKDLTVAFVKNRLTDEYKRRKNAAKSTEISQHETAMKATDGRVCFFCKLEGHWKR